MLLTDTTSFWEDFNRANPDTVYLDTETTGLDPHRDKLRTIQLFFGGKAYVYCVEKMDMDEVTEMVQAFAEKQVVAYNASFDFNFIYAATGVWLENVFCLYITERLLTPDKLIPADLESVAMRYLNYPMNKEIREKFLTEPEITEEMVAYAEADVAVLPEVHIHQLRRIRNLKLGYVQNFIEQPCVQYTAMMEYKGSFVDAAQFQKARDYFEITCLERNKKLQDIGIRQYFKNKKLPKRIFFNKQGTWSFNPTSTQQFSAVLSEYGINTKSISKDIISELDRAWKEDNSEEADEAAKNLEGTGIFSNPLIDAYYQYRKPTTLLNTFLKKWPTFIHSKTGAIHSRFNQYGTDTGRYSSSKPNRQQAPKLEDLEAINIPAEYGIRSCFISRPGTQLVICDYSALELAILGILSKDETVIKYLDPELDIHVYVAEKLFNTEIPLELKKKNPYKVYRNVAKTITYSIAYGATGHTVYARNGGILRSIGYTLTLERANEFIDIWKKDSFPKAGLWLTNTAEQVRKTFEARTGAGRIRRWNRNPPPGFIKKTRERFPHMNDEWIFARAKRGWTNTVMREGTNMTIQSSAADLTKMATCIVGNILKTKYNYQDAYIIAQIHDELVVEARNDIADEVLEITKWGMEEAGRIIFPHAPVGAIRASGSLSTVYDK